MLGLKTNPSWLVFFLASSLVLSKSNKSTAGSPSCLHALDDYIVATDGNKHFIHGDLSGRDFDFIKTRNPHLYKMIVNYHKKKKRILSLGEGHSGIISSLMQNTEKRLWDNLVAIDAGYPKVKDGVITDSRSPNTDYANNWLYNQRAVAFVTQYPQNFIHGTFQGFRLTNERGEIRQFDFVYSSYALNFVLRTPDARASLENVLNHVADNGVLLITPASADLISATLKDLKRSGKIKKFEIIDERNLLIYK